jgi:HEAT repeat protein
MGSLLLISGLGCAQTWDDLTAHSPEGGFANDLRFRTALLLHRRPPLEVLAESQDGDLRARAYKALKEPREHGGTDEDQKMMMDLLASAAKTEKFAYCRVAAVEKLGQFKDPRAVSALQDAFYAPANVSERNPIVRVAVVQQLARKDDAHAAKLLIDALGKDPARDVRLAAAEGLGHQRYAETAEALVQVLKDDQDVALRHVATESLKKITGKDMPAKPEPWEAYLQNPGSVQTADVKGRWDLDVNLANWRLW